MTAARRLASSAAAGLLAAAAAWFAYRVLLAVLTHGLDDAHTDPGGWAVDYIVPGVVGAWGAAARWRIR